MKSLNIILLILIIFIKTETNLSAKNLFFVNNIEIIKKKSSNLETLADEAIKKGFNELINKILLKTDIKKLDNLNFSQIKNLISYYQIIETDKINNNENKIVFNLNFDQEKIHNLFHNRNILYSNVSQSELYLLPVLKKDDQIFIYTQNFFYDNWNKTNDNKFVEFILPIENIEIIQIFNLNSKDLLQVDTQSVFKEYKNKNLAIVIIEEKNSKIDKVFLKTFIMGKKISKNIIVKDSNLSQIELKKKIILEIKEEIVNLVKSQNLIDIRTPSFINVKLMSLSSNNLVELKQRLNKLELIENIYIQELNSDYTTLKLKYLGKINKIIRQLESENIILELINDEWNLSII